MKNKDNIEIKIGQIWEALGGSEREVFGFADGKVIQYDHLRKCASDAPPLSNTFNRLISCPVLGGYMSEWDIVTAEQKRDYYIPTGIAQFFHPFDKIWKDTGAGSWLNGEGGIELYRVPRGFNWEPYRKEDTHSYALPMDHVEKTRQKSGAAKCEPAKIEMIEIYHRIDTCDPDSVRQAFEDYENKINEIINHLNREKAND